MTDDRLEADRLEAIQDALDRATALDAPAAEEVLLSARRDLEGIRAGAVGSGGEGGNEDGGTDAQVDENRLQSLADRLDQRLREIRERDAYDGSFGAAVDSTDENAP